MPDLPNAEIAIALKQGLIGIGSRAAERLSLGAEALATPARIGEERMRLAQACAAGFSTHPELNSGEAIWIIQRVALAAFDKRLAELKERRAAESRAA